MEFENLKTRGSQALLFGTCFTLVYAEPGKKVTPSWEINGISSDGSHVSISTSDVESVTLEAIEPLGGTLMARFAVVQFPNLPPADLVNRALSYSELLQFKRTFRVRIAIRSTSGGRLSIAGKLDEAEDEVRALADVETLEPGVSIQLRYANRNIWWAIPSVIADPRYPHRVAVNPSGDTRKAKEPEK